MSHGQLFARFIGKVVSRCLPSCNQEISRDCVQGLSEAYRRELAKVDPKDAKRRTYAEVLAEVTILKAKGGDVSIRATSSTIHSVGGTY
jgi:hypothetical protein